MRVKAKRRPYGISVSDKRGNRRIIPGAYKTKPAARRGIERMTENVPSSKLRKKYGWANPRVIKRRR